MHVAATTDLTALMLNDVTKPKQLKFDLLDSMEAINTNKVSECLYTLVSFYLA